MAGYDPKRPRPSVPEDQPAPVEALLDEAPPLPSDTSPDDDPSATTTIDVREPATGRVAMTSSSTAAEASTAPAASSAARSAPATPSGGTGSEVSVAPAPEEGTANRALLVAGIVAALGAVVALVLILRRRR